MKKIFMILTLGITMVSCSNTPTDVADPKKVTTVELQQLANIDSTTYKVVEKNDVVYVLSIKDNMVVKQIRNDSGSTPTLVLLVCVLVFMCMLIVSFIN